MKTNGKTQNIFTKGWIVITLMFEDILLMLIFKINLTYPKRIHNLA